MPRLSCIALAAQQSMRTAAAIIFCDCELDMDSASLSTTRRRMKGASAVLVAMLQGAAAGWSVVMKLRCSGQLSRQVARES